MAGERSAGGGAGGASHFKQGYQQGEPGYSSGYKSGEPLYKESIQRGNDGSYSANLEAEADSKVCSLQRLAWHPELPRSLVHLCGFLAVGVCGLAKWFCLVSSCSYRHHCCVQHWAEARELTLAAEREVASAKLSGKEASKELAAAEKAEDAVRKAQIKHREVCAPESLWYQNCSGMHSLKSIFCWSG